MGACKKANYCGKECQKAAWKGHKAICKQNRKASGDAQEPKKSKPKLPLTWAQLEQYGPSVATGKTLEVRVMEDRSMGRQCFGCKDRLGGVATIAAYTDSRRIPCLAAGKVLRWKNPRFHVFMNGSTGARIEEEDLANVTVTDA